MKCIVGHSNPHSVILLSMSRGVRLIDDINGRSIVFWFRTVFTLISMKESDIHEKTSSEDFIWVRSRNCGCLVTWFCYQLIAKPGNKTATVSWPGPYKGDISRYAIYWPSSTESRPVGRSVCARRSNSEGHVPSISEQNISHCSLLLLYWYAAMISLPLGNQVYLLCWQVKCTVILTGFNKWEPVHHPGSQETVWDI